MRKLKVYLDTSVVSYLYQLDTPEKMKDTLELWELFRQGRYEVYISDIVLNEISGYSQEKLDILLGYLKQVQYHLVHTDEDTVELAEKFIDFGILKKRALMTASISRRQSWPDVILLHPGTLNIS